MREDPWPAIRLQLALKREALWAAGLTVVSSEIAYYDKDLKDQVPASEIARIQREAGISLIGR